MKSKPRHMHLTATDRLNVAWRIAEDWIDSARRFLDSDDPEKCRPAFPRQQFTRDYVFGMVEQLQDEGVIQGWKVPSYNAVDIIRRRAVVIVYDHMRWSCNRKVSEWFDRETKPVLLHQ